MPIAGGILVAGTAAHCLSSVAGMFRFLARLSGRRRHVRRSCGPGGRGAGTTRTTGLTVVSASTGATALPSLPTSHGDGDIAAEETFVARSSSRRTTDEESEPRNDGTDKLSSSMANENQEGCCDNDDVMASRHRRLRHHHRHYRLEQRHSHHQRRQERLRRDGIASDDDVSITAKSEYTDPREFLFVAGEHHHVHHHHHHPSDHSSTSLSSDRQRLRDIHQRLHVDPPSTEDEEVGRERPVARLSPDTRVSSSTSVTAMTRGWRIPPYLATLLILSYTLFGIADACSSRSTPKPRPPAPTPRPNITFHMYTCPPDYAEWYCLNGATCFTVKIVDSLLYNCLCANGYIGQRCEFKDLDGSYLPSRQRVMLETASIAGGATIAVFLVVIICIAAYIHCKRKQKELRTSNGVDTVDGPGRDPELRPFSNRNRSLMIFMAKNPNNTTLNPGIEQTRMPEWNYPEAESTRMESISEGKRLVTDSTVASRAPESRLPKQR